MQLLSKTILLAFAVSVANLTLLNAQDDLAEHARRLSELEAAYENIAKSTQALEQRAKLTQAVRAAFEAKQELHRKQVELLSQRIELLKSDIDRRDSLATSIINRRVDQLLSNHEATELPPEPTSEDDGFIINVYYLQYIKAKDAYQVVSEILTSDSAGFQALTASGNIRLAVDERLNSLIFKGSVDAHEVVRSLIETLDRAPDDNTEQGETSSSLFRVFRVQGNAKALASAVRALFEKTDNVSIAANVPANSICVRGTEADQSRIAEWLAKNDQHFAYLVSIPSKEIHEAEILSVTDQIRTLEIRRHELREQVGASHPSTRALRSRLELLEIDLAKLQSDQVVYNIYLGIKKPEDAQAAIDSIKDIPHTKWRLHPAGHLELSGDRRMVEAFGDAIVSNFNSASQAAQPQSATKLWFDKLPPEQATNYLRELLAEGKMHLAVSLLKDLPKREQSKILQSIEILQGIGEQSLVEQLISQLSQQSAHSTKEKISASGVVKAVTKTSIGQLLAEITLGSADGLEIGSVISNKKVDSEYFGSVVAVKDNLAVAEFSQDSLIKKGDEVSAVPGMTNASSSKLSIALPDELQAAERGKVTAVLDGSRGPEAYVSQFKSTGAATGHKIALVRESQIIAFGIVTKASKPAHYSISYTMLNPNQALQLGDKAINLSLQDETHFKELNRAVSDYKDLLDDLRTALRNVQSDDSERPGELTARKLDLLQKRLNIILPIESATSQSATK